MLDAENSKREQDQEENRSANQWSLDITKENIKYIKYKKEKKSVEELLKTTPINLNPFYKNKVKSYFKNALND